MTPFMFIDQLQQLFNAALHQDDNTRAEIQKLSGKVIRIEVAGPEIIVLLHFESGQVRFSTDTASKADVIIRAKPAAFIQLALLRNEDHHGPAPELEIRGEAGLAQRFQHILNSLEIDWEEHLSRWVGDTAAHKLGRIARQTRVCLQEARHTLGLDISEYLRYEKEMLPEREEVEEFITAVDNLRNDAERLRQRLERLQQLTAGHTHG